MAITITSSINDYKRKVLIAILQSLLDLKTIYNEETKEALERKVRAAAEGLAANLGNVKFGTNEKDLLSFSLGDTALNNADATTKNYVLRLVQSKREYRSSIPRITDYGAYESVTKGAIMYPSVKLLSDSTYHADTRAALVASTADDTVSAFVIAHAAGQGSLPPAESAVTLDAYNMWTSDLAKLKLIGKVLPNSRYGDDSMLVIGRADMDIIRNMRDLAGKLRASSNNLKSSALTMQRYFTVAEEIDQFVQSAELTAYQTQGGFTVEGGCMVALAVSATPDMTASFELTSTTGTVSLGNPETEIIISVADQAAYHLPNDEYVIYQLSPVGSDLPDDKIGEYFLANYTYQLLDRGYTILMAMASKEDALDSILTSRSASGWSIPWWVWLIIAYIILKKDDRGQTSVTIVSPSSATPVTYEGQANQIGIAQSQQSNTQP